MVLTLVDKCVDHELSQLGCCDALEELPCCGEAGAARMSPSLSNAGEIIGRDVQSYKNVHLSGCFLLELQLWLVGWGWRALCNGTVDPEVAHC